MTDPFELVGSLEPATVPPERGAEVLCHLRLRAWAHAFAADAPTAVSSICLVVDCSSSMSGPKLQAAIDAAKAIVATVHERQRLSIVCFQTSVEVLVDNVQATASRKNGILWQIDNIPSLVGGSTNLAAALRQARRTLEAQPADARVIVLLTDGEADDRLAAEKASVDASASGIQLFAVGVGSGYAAGDLLRLVTPSNGAVFGEAEADKIKETFTRLIGRIDAFVATSARLAVTLAQGVRAGAAFKTSPERAPLGRQVADANRQLVLTVGNLERDQTYAFLLPLDVPPRPRGEHEVLRATLSYDAPSLQLRGHAQELVVSLLYDEERTDANNTELRAALRGARRAELVQELAEAHRRQDKRQLEDKLSRLAAEADAPLAAECGALLDGLRRRGSITQERLNAVIVGGVAKADDALEASYDVVLLAAGPQLIRIVREVRAVTGLPLRKVNELVTKAPSPIRQAVPQLDATALRQRLETFGARVELREVRRRGPG